MKPTTCPDCGASVIPGYACPNSKCKSGYKPPVAESANRSVLTPEELARQGITPGWRRDCSAKGAPDL